MNLAPHQRTVLLVLTADWLSPLRINNLLPEDSKDLAAVNQSLQAFMRAGLVQANPVTLGLYRLTAEGTALKESESESGGNE